MSQIKRLIDGDGKISFTEFVCLVVCLVGWFWFGDGINTIPYDGLNSSSG